jgi:glycosyltransferase involved in cell wall biosynthesis
VRVLHLTSDYPPNPLWGMGWHVYNLREELIKHGVEVIIGTANKSKQLHPGIVTTSNQQDTSLLSNKKFEIFNDFANFNKWQKKLADTVLRQGITPDIIHCHNWMSWITTKEIARNKPHTRIVVTFHLLQKQYETMKENPIPSFHEDIIKFEEEMLDVADVVIVQSFQQQRLLRSYQKLTNQNKIYVIPGVLDRTSSTFENTTNTKASNPYLDIIFVGRLERDKGVLEAIRAFQRLNTEGISKPVRLHIVGKGPYLEDLRTRYASEKVIFHGFLDRFAIFEILEKSSIFILPSTSESFGQSVIEAMMCGVVPIFSRGNSVPSLYRDNVHGMKIDIKRRDGINHIPVGDIKEIFELLIHNDDLREKMSYRSYHYSHRVFSPNVITQKIIDAYSGT